MEFEKIYLCFKLKTIGLYVKVCRPVFTVFPIKLNLSGLWSAIIVTALSAGSFFIQGYFLVEYFSDNHVESEEYDDGRFALLSANYVLISLGCFVFGISMYKKIKKVRYYQSMLLIYDLKLNHFRMAPVSKKNLR